jgi:hypothetical protein
MLSLTLVVLVLQDWSHLPEYTDPLHLTVYLSLFERLLYLMRGKPFSLLYYFSIIFPFIPTIRCLRAARPAESISRPFGSRNLSDRRYRRTAPRTYRMKLYWLYTPRKSSFPLRVSQPSQAPPSSDEEPQALPNRWLIATPEEVLQAQVRELDHV